MSGFELFNHLTRGGHLRRNRSPLLPKRCSAGFAFGSPAHASVIAEMVSKDDLASAYTLAGMQMDLSGIIGPLFSALLLSLAGVSFIFGANGLGFLLMFLALLQWKRVTVQSSLPDWQRIMVESFPLSRGCRVRPGAYDRRSCCSSFSEFRSILPKA
jgi:MFS family permease